MLESPTVRAVTPSQRIRRLLESGDLLLEKSGGGDLQPVGTVVLFDTSLPTPTVCSNFVARMPVARGFSPRFSCYLHQALYGYGAAEICINQTTGIQNLDSHTYLSTVVSLPDLSGQDRVADFLDRRTALIDELIAQKTRLVGLLTEKRHVLITQFVTKGRLSGVKMKDSGVPWIGQMPGYWRAQRIKFLCRLESGHTPSRTETSYWVPEECVIPWVSLNDTNGLEAADYINDTAVKISAVGMANSSAHMIPAGAVVFNRDGARVGLAAITTRAMAVSQHIIAWVCGPLITNAFLLHVIYAMQDELVRLTTGATIPTIGMGDVRELVAPLPPIEEQKEIVSDLVKIRTELSLAIDAVQNQIDRLYEYRQAIITAAVTGKLDVDRARSETDDRVEQVAEGA